MGNKTICLSGEDIAALLDGRKIQTGGIELVFDGIGAELVEVALERFKKASEACSQEQNTAE